MNMKECKLKQVLQYAAAILPALTALLLCGCALTVPIEREEDSREIEYPNGLLTTAISTTVTTTNVYTPPDDPSIVSMLNEMTLEEKAAQMMMVGCNNEIVGKAAASQGAGGLCMFSQPFEGKNTEQVQEMTADFQSVALVPMLLAVDEEGGTVNRISLNPELRPQIFFSPSYLFEQGGMDLIREDTAEKADFLMNLGINVNLAPVCDVPQTENDFIYPRAFSTDAEKTSKYISTVVSIMTEKGIGCTLKHFPGYGGSADTHLNMAYDEREFSAFEQNDFLPFAAGIACGADSVMVSHNIVQCMDDQLPASLSPEVHRILRETLGFRGVIISDDLSMNAITQFTGGQNPAVAAVKAGNDMLCYADMGPSVTAIVDAVESGEIDIEQINASVLRILAWKQRLNLLQ